MKSERWRRLEQIYHAAQMRSADERASFLAEACADDETLRREVESMLDAPATAELFLAVPALAVAAGMVSDLATPALTGRRLGIYHMKERLGIGGMGEVYRARDTQLGRDVAVKILPPAFTANPDRRARLEREARALAALNHPNIATIHGIENSEGIRALVMELVEGQTLAERLAGSSMQIREALVVAQQIADALDAAHEKGIIHRDLKPANIMVTPDGVVKVLDFGLAKAAVDDEGRDLSQSPTGTDRGTHEGVVLGTAAYMSPDQARGKPVDKRTDIWAFGCVLYEMLTGRVPFLGETLSDTVAAILAREPDWDALPVTTPVRIGWLLRRCLEKDPKRRIRDIADARLEIEEAQNELLSPPTPPPPLRRAERLAWLGAVGVLSLVAVAVLVVRDRFAVDTRPYRTSIVLPEGVRFATARPSSRENPAGRFVLSPDGRYFAFVAARAGERPMLWVRRLDTLVAQQLAGTDGAEFPFWSPDSRFLAFHADGKLKKIEASGGIPFTIGDAAPRGTGAWNRDDIILFVPSAASPIYRVSASGGTPVPVTVLDAAVGDAQHWYPFFLPDGRHFLYFAVGSRTGGVNDPRAVYVGSLDPEEPGRLLIQGGSNAKYAQGHLMFMRGSTLMAQRFDLDCLELLGEALPLAEQLQFARDVSPTAGAFTVSENGALAYQTGSDTVQSQLMWFDRSGKQIAVLGDPADNADVALSPDGQRVAVSILDPERRTRDLWLYDVSRSLRTRVTFESANDFAPSWSPDGSRLLFSSIRKGGAAVDLYEKGSGGTGVEDVVLLDDMGKYLGSWSYDGRFILYVAGSGVVGRSDLWILPLFGDRKPVPFLETSFIETHGQFSPDGRWIAYTSTESGQREVYVAPFRGAGAKSRVSSAGGGWPRWRRDGREIFYLSADNTLTAAAVIGRTSGVDVGAARPLFSLRPRPPVRLDAYPYDASADGQRFLVNTLAEETASPDVTLLVNWTALLEK